MSRETGWYPVFNKETSEYEFAKYSNEQWKFVGRTIYADMIHKYYDIPEDKPPVNPMPADGGYIYYAVEEHDEDMNFGVGGWQVIVDEFTEYSEAESWMKSYEDYEYNSDRFRVVQCSLEARVVKEAGE